MDINIDDYKSLNLTKDPFSTAPDPEFLYQSRQHFGTLQLLECAIKKEKGMSVVLGPAGTGKTTICRQLYRKISFVKNVNAQVMTARYYENSDQLIRDIADIFGFVDIHNDEDIFDVFMNNYMGNGNKVALIIDNGHLIPEYCLSVLNRLNDLKSKGENFFKIVIFAKKEFSSNIEANPDFQSRIVNYRILGPLNFRDTRQMIQYRLKMATASISATRSSRALKLFSYPAMLAIYLATGGYPRKIVILCHRCVVALLLTNSFKAGWFMVRSHANRVLESRKFIPESAVASALFIGPLVAVALGIGVVNNHDFNKYLSAVEHIVETVAMEDRIPVKKTDTIEIIAEADEMIVPEVFFQDDTPTAGISDETEQIEISADNGMIQEKTKQAAKPVDEEVINPVNDRKDFRENIPELIGSVEVRRGDSLLVMLESVYGHSRPKYKNPVVSANDHISNINNLEIGDKIHFPPVIVNPSKPDSENVWIRLRSVETLDAAIGFKKAWPLKDVRLKVIPYFHEDSGLTFDIVVKKLYATKEDANIFITGLSESVTEKPEIIKFQLSKSVFFADPYAM